MLHKQREKNMFKIRRCGKTGTAFNSYLWIHWVLILCLFQTRVFKHLLGEEPAKLDIFAAASEKFSLNMLDFLATHSLPNGFGP